MSNSSLKKTMIRSYATLSNLEEMEGNNLIIITPAGTITGIMITKTSRLTNYEKLFVKINNNLMEEFDSDKIGENDGFLTLRDAKLITSGSTIINFNLINIFYDQIIAVTVGKLEH